jgi:lysophospholipase L1-like esterase
MKNLFLFLQFMAIGAFAQTPNKFESDIKAFEKADQVQPVDKKNLIVFTGSSSIVKWNTLKSDFPDKNVINRGFGGSETADLFYFVDRVVNVYQPKQVFIYEGDNDLAAQKEPSQVLADFKLVFAKIREKSKNTRISFISIKPSPSRRALLAKQRLANELIKAFLAGQKNTDFIDVFNAMLLPKDEFRAEAYVADSLHMTPEGYKIWKNVIQPYVK